MGDQAATKRFGHVPDEWICQLHWSRISRRERAIWSRMKRRARKFGEWASPDAAGRIWAALKRKASQGCPRCDNTGLKDYAGFGMDPCDCAASCPNFVDHTPCPDGYLEWQAWAEKMSKTHKQRKCAGCGRQKIWERK